jgi:acetyl esterase/lipase
MLGKFVPISLLPSGLALAALSLMASAVVSQADSRANIAGSATVKTIKASRLTADDTLGDLLDHPCLSGFAERTLPWDGRAYDRSLPLGRIGSLLPYHSELDTEAILSGLNLLVENAQRGVEVFHDIYSEEEKHRNPDLRATGLFFFPGKPGAPFAVIAPGGGFSYVGSLHEGFPYAAAINDLGYNAFVLKYRAGKGGRPATEDLAAAISYIFDNAGTLGVGTEGYSVWGSSAGARMAAAIGSYGVPSFGGRDLPKPSTVVMAYTGHSDYADDEPSTFVVAGEDDWIAPPAAMERRVAALRRAGAKVEFHVFPSVGHGFGMGTGTSAEGWIGDAVRFWEEVTRDLDREE